MNQIIKKFCHFYQALTIESLAELADIYNENATFEDPLHNIQGLNEINRYFERLLVSINYCHFHIDNVLEEKEQALITWVMTFVHPKLNKGREISVNGSSHLKFNETIFYQRDYYDMGQMVYEQIPLLKLVIGKIKNRMTS